MAEPVPARWHALTPEETAEHLGGDLAKGLSPTEASRRLASHGPNRLTSRRGPGVVLRFIRQFNQPLVYLLIAAGIVTFLLDETVDSVVILAVVLVNGIVGFIQESRAEHAIAALATLVPEEATVVRNAHRQRVPVSTLVPGDLVDLEAGDRIPADLRLISLRGLRVEEAMLTGESAPVGKALPPLPPATALAERKNCVYAGSLATAGVARGIVVATGDATETGRIAGLLRSADDLATPLTRQIARFSHWLMIVIVLVAAAAFWIGIERGHRALDMFMAAVALAVGAIPEGLPAAITITLAVGVNRMAGRRAIIRKLPAVETLGSTTVICSDKTGTLTRNEMTVRMIAAGGRIHAVSGIGYSVDGHVNEGDAPNAALHATLLCGLLCNEARLVRRGANHAIEGDPTEGALLVAAAKAGFDTEVISQRHRRLDLIPFTSEQQSMATLHETQPGAAPILWIKGSVERLLPRCVEALGADGHSGPLDEAAVRKQADRLAADGLRVLLFARRYLPVGTMAAEPTDLNGGLQYLGLQAMIDPPREEAAHSVRQCHRAGIQVKMITGDNPVTARAVAAAIGLGGEGVSAKDLPTLTGRDLAQLDAAALEAAAEHTLVFARVEPEQKLRLVQALQRRNHVVAMTGDGVNDAPALRQANIGVAMGITGTDVAKGAADMLLTDDNFASIEAAVEEGRGIFENLTKFIVWTLPTNAGEAMLLLLAIGLGTALPALPLHLLWINMTTAILLGLMLVFEPKEAGLMNRPPRDPCAPILDFSLLMRTGLVTLCMTAGAYGLFHWELAQGSSLPQARTAVVNVIVAVEMAYLLNCRSLTRSVRCLGWGSNPPALLGILGMAMLQIAFTHLPAFNRIFQTAPLRPVTWLLVVLCAVAVFLVVGLEKWIRFGRKSRSLGPNDTASAQPKPSAIP